MLIINTKIMLKFMLLESSRCLGFSFQHTQKITLQCCNPQQEYGRAVVCDASPEPNLPPPTFGLGCQILLVSGRTVIRLKSLSVFRLQIRGCQHTTYPTATLNMWLVWEHHSHGYEKQLWFNIISWIIVMKALNTKEHCTS